MIGTDKNNLLHNLSLTNRQVVSLCKALANSLSRYIKLPNTQISKIIQSGGFLARHFGPLIKAGLSMMKNVLTPLPRNVLMPLGLTAAASTSSAETHKNILGSGASGTAILIISNKKMRKVMEIGKSLEVSSMLIKCVTQTIENEMENKKTDSLVCD